jgi:hypothetical protein
LIQAQRGAIENSFESFFQGFSEKFENSIVILAQQVLSLADRGYFCIYHQRDF